MLLFVVFVSTIKNVIHLNTFEQFYNYSRDLTFLHNKKRNFICIVVFTFFFSNNFYNVILQVFKITRYRRYLSLNNFIDHSFIKNIETLRHKLNFHLYCGNV